MFCGSCGAKNEDGALFCAECGAVLNPDQPPVQNFGEVPQPEQKSTNTRLVGMIAVGAVALIAVVILLVSLFSGGGPSGVVDDALDAMFSADADDFVDLIPDAVMDMLEEQAGMSRKDFVESLQEELDDLEDEMEQEDASIDWDITDEDELSKKEVKALQSSYDMVGIDMKITEAAEVKVKLIAKMDGEKETETITFPVIKVDGDWYIDFFNLPNVMNF